MRRLLFLLTLVAVAALSPAGTAAAATHSIGRLHDARYCEIFELHGVPPDATVTVWNTIGLNRCPDAWWRGFEAGPLARELGATLVVLNGPRHFLMDAASATTGGVRTFHGRRMRKVATIAIHSSAELAQTPYTDRTITRTNTWSWRAGRRIFELVAPGGDTYVMQSYAQIKDPSLRLASLTRLGRRLHLPDGWRYRTRVLKRPLVLRARGSATVLQDELQNTYQLAKTVRRGGKRASHSLSLAGRTHTVTPATAGTVEDHGSVTGKPFGKGRIVLVGRFANSTLNGTFRLTFPRGQVIGTTVMPYTISGNTITFSGTSVLTGGTGIYRGITSGPLETHDTNTLDGQNGVLSVAGRVRY